MLPIQVVDATDLPFLGKYYDDERKDILVVKRYCINIMSDYEERYIGADQAPAGIKRYITGSMVWGAV